jgi:hypothetical protein
MKVNGGTRPRVKGEGSLHIKVASHCHKPKKRYFIGSSIQYSGEVLPTYMKGSESIVRDAAKQKTMFRLSANVHPKGIAELGVSADIRGQPFTHTQGGYQFTSNAFSKSRRKISRK